ncbi:hypothetical protein Q3G72_020090 [Acer saccharum]|nr:hypothetical protein Q3G72_020090 [Acer saccharum]
MGTARKKYQKEGYCYTRASSVGVPYVCCFQTDCGDRVTYKDELTFRASRNYEDSIFINSDHVILGYHEYSHGELSMATPASVEIIWPSYDPTSQYNSMPQLLPHNLEVFLKAPEHSHLRIPLMFRGLDTSESCRLKYCGLACGSSTVGFSLSVSFVDFVFLGCWCSLCFNSQLNVKLTCHLMYEIRLSKGSENRRIC